TNSPIIVAANQATPATTYRGTDAVRDPAAPHRKSASTGARTIHASSPSSRKGPTSLSAGDPKIGSSAASAAASTAPTRPAARPTVSQRPSDRASRTRAVHPPASAPGSRVETARAPLPSNDQRARRGPDRAP